MRALLAGVVLAWLTVGALACPLAAVSGLEDRGHGSHPALSAGLSLESGLAICRSGSSSRPESGAHAFAILDESALPHPMAFLAVATAVDSAMVSLLELTHPQRGPPSSFSS